MGQQSWALRVPDGLEGAGGAAFAIGTSGARTTRITKRFDLLANGGASLTLRFERAPFLSQARTVWLPWGRFYAMDTLVLKTEESAVPGCDLSGFARPDPLVVASPLSSFFSSKPGEKPIIPETQVLHEQIEVPGTSLKLCYLSSRTQGYHTLLKVTMTPAVVSMGLLKVHLMVAVEGHLFQKWFHASPNLAYTYIWDKTDAYSQRDPWWGRAPPAGAAGVGRRRRKKRRRGRRKRRRREEEERRRRRRRKRRGGGGGGREEEE
ncbi:hypothetical protein CRUP_029214 [Coryphaenoides rupestris]|nr:hypothetical protein CRUP_029214 [Coryphaenoides rupestris]